MVSTYAVRRDHSLLPPTLVLSRLAAVRRDWQTCTGWPVSGQAPLAYEEISSTIYVSTIIIVIHSITKTIFMIGMCFLGIKILSLKPILYITLLCSTWFIFHISEAFYTQNLFKEKIHNREKS